MTIHTRWQRLSKRERQLLLLVAAVLSVAALWRFVWLPVAWRSEAGRALQAEQLTLARRLASTVSEPTPEQGFTTERLHASATQAGMDVKRIEVSGGRAQFIIEGAAAALWPWVEALDRSNLKLETFRLAKEGGRLRLLVVVSGLAPAD